MSHITLFTALLLATVLLGYPAAALLQHGLDPAFWPRDAPSLAVWFDTWARLGLGTIAETYWSMLIGRSAVFANGGWTWSSIMVLLPILIQIAFWITPGRPQPKRDPSDLFGSARFATPDERRRMNGGLELGLDPDSGRAVRVRVQGTLVTLAPPRKGKTSGLLIPNLAYPEPGAWTGPAVVLDSKGEVYRATAGRRRALGRRVVCLDPLGLVGGLDRWNPLATRSATDVLYLQHTALALLPEPTSNDEASAYFRNRAADLITGAMLIVLRSKDRTVERVQRLITDDELFIERLEAYIARWPEPAARSALEILKADPKTRDPVKSTALQAFQWLADERLRALVGESTFDLADLSSGDVDLFVAIPPEYKRLLAPLLRWLLSDLFTAVRRNRPRERILVFIDEAAALGRFDEILTAAGELPGYGASLWTFWQDRSQMVALYGESGASTILNTAEVVTVSDLTAVDPEESERWSKAIGSYTAAVDTTSRPTDGKGAASATRSPQAAPLLTKEALVTLPPGELLVFPNSGDYGRHPVRLHKTVAHRDPRFERLIEKVEPVGRTG